ncbi:toxin-antitoxin system YwqK family antitoxin [Mucilaginibacter sp. UYCu711]|uniref:toxin-antitoxin system YwqK family antitoxin n=1 Tax=Mucilaginibacter sp. UYCu711 TaxID=3156339 RepID=UPI003D1F81AC
MKKLLLFTAIILCLGDCFAQKVIERKNKLINNVTERYETVIEATKQVKHGVYHAFFGKKIVLASGKYVNDKKVGIWHYFDRDGTLMQNYDYDHNKLSYEAPEGAPLALSYNIDYYIKDNDVATQPVRPGGRYFGYVPYLRAFKLPPAMDDEDLNRYLVTFDLLISPMGRLAEFVVHISRRGTGVDQMVYNINTDLFSDDDKTFIPATLNKNPVASQIHVLCAMDLTGALDMLYLIPKKTTAP